MSLPAFRSFVCIEMCTRHLSHLLQFRIWYNFSSRRREAATFIWHSLGVGTGPLLPNVPPGSSVTHPLPWPKLQQSTLLQINQFKGGNAFHFLACSFDLEGLGWKKRKNQSCSHRGSQEGFAECMPVQQLFSFGLWQAD